MIKDKQNRVKDKQKSLKINKMKKTQKKIFFSPWKCESCAKTFSLEVEEDEKTSRMWCPYPCKGEMKRVKQHND